jgi:hypothetical protein
MLKGEVCELIGKKGVDEFGRKGGRAGAQLFSELSQAVTTTMPARMSVAVII